MPVVEMQGLKNSGVSRIRRQRLFMYCSYRQGLKKVQFFSRSNALRWNAYTSDRLSLNA